MALSSAKLRSPWSSSKSVKMCCDVIEGVGPLRVARHQGALPRRQLAVDVLGEAIVLLLQAGDLFGDIHRRIVLHEAQFFDLRLEFGNRLFKIQERGFHQGSSD
jgi:hypothetical protein